jgi:hypothetical protein
MASRREFLKMTGLAPAVMLAAQCTREAAAAPADQPGLPQIAFGKYRLSRLVCGANPFNGGSHLSTFVNREMLSYFTPDQILKTLRRCQEVGINCWQAGTRNCDLYRRFTDEGGKMHFLAIESKAESIKRLVEAGCIGVAHHGEVSDQLFKSGQIDKIGDFLKKAHDAGLMAGVSTHMPDVVDAIESKGWEVDYYMTCVYQRNRSKEELEKLLGYVPLQVGETYLPQDPPRMFKSVQQTKRPCLAFKILAAGRLSERKEQVEQAFREAFRSIKPGDGVIVGIYDRYSDQPMEDAALVRRFATPAKPHPARPGGESG